MNKVERSPAAQALIDYAIRIETQRNALKAALQMIHDQPNCRHEVEAQLKEIYMKHFPRGSHQLHGGQVIVSAQWIVDFGNAMRAKGAADMKERAKDACDEYAADINRGYDLGVPYSKVIDALRISEVRSDDLSPNTFTPTNKGDSSSPNLEGEQG